MNYGLHIVLLSILIFIISISYQSGNENEIDTIALVTPESYAGPIIVFHTQDTTIGNIRLNNGKHFFYVSPDNVFFTKEVITTAFIVYYCEEKGKLIKKDYVSSMRIKTTDEKGFQVVGGGSGSVNTEGISGAKTLTPYVVFSAGLASHLRYNWNVSDSIIKNLYAEKLKELGFHSSLESEQ